MSKSVILHQILLTNRSKEDNTYVACSLHIVKKKGIRSLLRKPEQQEPLGRLGSIM